MGRPDESTDHRDRGSDRRRPMGTGRHDRDKSHNNRPGGGGTRTPANVEGTGLEGKIQKLVTDKGFGFIDGENGVRYFFHRSGVLPSDGVYENLYEGERVRFDGMQSPKGPRCQSVVSLETIEPAATRNDSPVE